MPKEKRQRHRFQLEFIIKCFSHELELMLDYNEIQTADTFKMLGIQVDQMLTSDKRIDSVCLNITLKITLMKMNSKYVNNDSLQLYYINFLHIAFV